MNSQELDEYFFNEFISKLENTLKLMSEAHKNPVELNEFDRSLSGISRPTLKDVGFKIIAEIKKLKENLKAPLTTIDLVYTLDILNSFLTETQSQTGDILDRDDLFKPFNTKIKMLEFNKLLSKICIFVSLSVMLASISLLAFCIATGGAGLIPLAVGGFSLCAIIMGIGVNIGGGGKHFERALTQEGVMNYFFKSTTPESDSYRKSVSILRGLNP